MFSDPTYQTTEGVRVSVQSAWLKDRSNPVFGMYMFAYRVSITNNTETPVQLLRRKWIITDGVGIVRRVEGDGVIGEQPILEPGASHEYISGCDFVTPIGKMEGHYEMVRGNNEHFFVQIPAFTLAVPYYLN